jgi:hypothetical protein
MKSGVGGTVVLFVVKVKKISEALRDGFHGLHSRGFSAKRVEPEVQLR